MESSVALLPGSPCFTLGSFLKAGMLEITVVLEQLLVLRLITEPLAQEMHFYPSKIGVYPGQAFDGFIFEFC